MSIGISRLSNRPGPFHEGKRPIQSGVALVGGNGGPGGPEYEQPDEERSFPELPQVPLPARDRRMSGEAMEDAMLDALAKQPAAVAEPALVPGTGRMIRGVVIGVVAGGLAAGAVVGFGGGFFFRAPTFQPGTVVFQP